MIQKTYPSSLQPDVARPRPAGTRATGGPPRRPATAAKPSAPGPAALETEKPRPSALVGRLLIALCFLGFAVFAVRRIMGSGEFDAVSRGIATRIADYERGKAKGDINYDDPVYDKALEDLRAIATSPASSAESKRLLEDLEAKRRAFAARQKEEQARIDAELAAQDARLAAEIELQKQTTGIDPGAADRLAAAAAAECKEDRH